MHTKHPITITLLLFTIIFSLSSFKPKDPASKKNFIQLSDSVYLCKYEVSQTDYKAFLASIKKHDTQYIKYYPDTTQWTSKFPNAFTQPWQEKYFNHEAFNRFPVVNITRKAAEAYCLWLTNAYQGKAKVKFRLATTEEWLKAAKLSNINKENLIDKDGKYMANLKFLDRTTNEENYKYATDGTLITASVYSYESKTSKVCNIIGNVAEMTKDGQIVGGSWKDTYEESKPGQYQSHQLPDPRVGFRVVMELE